MKPRLFCLKQQGLGLLELILSIVLITIITLMSIQYFSPSKRAMMVSKAVDEIQAIINVTMNIPDLYSLQGEADTLTNMIALSGQIPSTYIYKSTDGKHYQIATPWSETGTNNTLDGSFCTSPTELSSMFCIMVATTHQTSGLTFLIQSVNLPNWACAAIADKFKAMASYADCVGSDETELRLEFPIKRAPF